MARTKDYKKLPGKKRKFMGFNTLWLGKDHLLSVDSRIYSEDYKRFYFKDIQAIIGCKMNSWKIINIILAAIALLLLWLSFSVGPAGSIFLKFMSCVFLLGLLVYLLWGPSWACSLKTAIQTENLPSLYRFRKFKKALRLLGPQIEMAQGNLAISDIKEAASSYRPNISRPSNAVRHSMNHE